jgi:hypothetical protein
MRGSGGHVGIAFATENSEMIICGWLAEQGKVRGGEL